VSEHSGVYDAFISSSVKLKATIDQDVNQAREFR
jgi:hypothetical protein